MIDFDFSTFCTGCSACSNICPTNAINMIANSEGFLMPHIDIKLCINCGKCEKVCAYENDNIQKNQEVKGSWLYSSKNIKAKMKSSSGAACFELSKAMIESGGYVAGCVWTDDLEAVHIIGNDMNTLERTQGSKYLQSNLGDTYKIMTELLKQGYSVLFTGTPCQAEAAHNYILSIENGKYRDLLITAALICHGVASPLVWQNYKTYMEKIMSERMLSVNFRDKSKEGYKKSYCRYGFSNDKEIYQPTYFPSSKYIEATLVYNLALRNSCYHCNCKGMSSGIDIILGDWYAENSGEGKLGTSCIVAFTNRGFNYVENHLENLREFPFAAIKEKNNFIEKSVTKNKNREYFFKHICEEEFWNNVEKLYPPKYRIKKFLIKSNMYDIVKKIIG